MLKHSLSQLAAWCGGRVVGKDVVVTSVSIDSRQIKDHALFIALAGERVDGHQFVDNAQKAGALAALVSEQQSTDLSQIVVANTEQALADIAAGFRQQYQGAVIAITGSSGKTTTRNMLAAILREKAQVSETLGNFNNDIGLPLSILAADLQADYWILEMGAAQVGDISRLMRIVQPTVSAITQVGVAHIGRFGSQGAIAKAKAEIFQLAPAATAIINADDANVVAQSENIAANKLSFSVNTDSADLYASAVKLTAEASRFDLHYQQETIAVSLPIAGYHNVANALCASACALAAGASLDDCKNGLANIHIEQGRLATDVASTGAILIDDSYNANPQSVKAAIDVLSLYDNKRTILVLGDMGELGDEAALYHQQMGEYALQKSIDVLLSVGEHSRLAQQAFGENAKHFEDKPALLAYLVAHSNSGDVILVKGSRSAHMEHIVLGLKQEESALCC